MTTMALYLCLLMAAATPVEFSQGASPDALAFEAASVKPAQSMGGRFTMKGGPGTGDPVRIAYTNIMLRRILLVAYDVRDYQISGPDWLDSLRFDITAKVPAGASKAEFQAMLRNLLATRFQMVVHRETKELPIYELLVAKNGIRVKRVVDDGAPAATPGDQLATIKPIDGNDGFPALSLPAPGLVIETRNGQVRVTSKETSMAKFADLLSGQLGHPVIDSTGLAGNYSFVLYFSPDGLSSSDAAGPSGPSIFGALQEQLGLKLEARKGPVDLLVIDHAEKVPAGN